MAKTKNRKQKSRKQKSRKQKVIGGVTRTELNNALNKATELNNELNKAMYTFVDKTKLLEAVNQYCANKEKAKKKYGADIGDWIVSGVTDMSNLFKCKTDFNEDISKWDVS